MLWKSLEFREMHLVTPRFKLLLELVAGGSLKILKIIFVTSSVQFTESAKVHMRLLVVVTDDQESYGAR